MGSQEAARRARGMIAAIVAAAKMSDDAAADGERIHDGGLVEQAAYPAQGDESHDQTHARTEKNRICSLAKHQFKQRAFAGAQRNANAELLLSQRN